MADAEKLRAGQGARGQDSSREDARDTPGGGFAGKRVELAACETRLRARARCASVSAYNDAKLHREGARTERVSDAGRGWELHRAILRAETRTVRRGAARPPDANSVAPGALHHLHLGHIHGHVARASGDVAPRCAREISRGGKKTRRARRGGRCCGTSKINHQLTSQNPESSPPGWR